MGGRGGGRRRRAPRPGTRLRPRQGRWPTGGCAGCGSWWLLISLSMRLASVRGQLVHAEGAAAIRRCADVGAAAAGRRGITPGQGNAMTARVLVSELGRHRPLGSSAGPAATARLTALPLPLLNDLTDLVAAMPHRCSHWAVARSVQAGQHGRGRPGRDDRNPPLPERAAIPMAGCRGVPGWPSCAAFAAGPLKRGGLGRSRAATVPMVPCVQARGWAPSDVLRMSRPAARA